MATDKLTIEIDPGSEGLDGDDFKTVIEKMLILLRGVDRAISPNHQVNNRWIVSRVVFGSPGVMVLQRSRVGEDTNPIGPLIEDVNSLENDGETKYMGASLREHARDLLMVRSRSVSRIAFASNGEMVVASPRLIKRVEELRRETSEIGSIEGRLDRLDGHQGDRVFVWDARHGARVECCVSDAQLEKAKSLFKKRVAVRGQITCAGGRPITVVDVYNIEPLGEDDELPRYEDVAPVDLTGGMEAGDYLYGEDDGD
jgi:hypothetical protein